MTFLFTLKNRLCQCISSVKNIFNYILGGKTNTTREFDLSSTSQDRFILRFLFSIKELTTLLSTTLDTGIQWTDESLIWNHNSFRNITKINVPQNDIWKPDFVLRNAISITIEAMLPFSYISVEYIGRITR